MPIFAICPTRQGMSPERSLNAGAPDRAATTLTAVAPPAEDGAGASADGAPDDDMMIATDAAPPRPPRARPDGTADRLGLAIGPPVCNTVDMGPGMKMKSAAGGAPECAARPQPPLIMFSHTSTHRI